MIILIISLYHLLLISQNFSQTIFETIHFVSSVPFSNRLFKIIFYYTHKGFESNLSNQYSNARYFFITLNPIFNFLINSCSMNNPLAYQFLLSRLFKNTPQIWMEGLLISHNKHLILYHYFLHNESDRAINLNIKEAVKCEKKGRDNFTVIKLLVVSVVEGQHS